MVHISYVHSVMQCIAISCPFSFYCLCCDLIGHNFSYYVRLNTSAHTFQRWWPQLPLNLFTLQRIAGRLRAVAYLKVTDAYIVGHITFRSVI